VINLKIVII